MNLAVLPYFAAIWAFGTHVGEIATPWTIGYIILWLIFSPIACWIGVFVWGGAYRFFPACLVVLFVAAFYAADARTTLLTLVASGMVGTVPWVWIPAATFVTSVAAIWIWYHGGIGL